jgi:hypothetical protein
MGFKMALPLNLVGDGLQPAKPGHWTCRNAFQKAVIRTVFDERCGKWSIAGNRAQEASDSRYAISRTDRDTTLLSSNYRHN